MKYRKHIRLREYDYTTPNYYFVTVCTKNREELFYPKIDPKYGFELSTNVAAASYAANNTSVFIQCLIDMELKYYNNLRIDFYCVMLEHVHIIVVFHDKVTKKGAIGSRNYSLSDIVRALKSTVSRDVGTSIWQPNYYEHVIRNEQSLDRIRKYILNNPMIQYNNIPWRTIDPNM